MSEPADAPATGVPTERLGEERASFQRLRELFDRLSDELVDGPAELREEAIARATADAPELAGQLRAMLALAARRDTALDAAALSLPDDAVALPAIPGYRVERRIGRGGSATVYLAEQERSDFSRRVALKVVDRVVEPATLRRVGEEQRILARLEHPGIARLYDAGVTPAGQPYLAMEHVLGVSILEHCRARHLPVAARLEIFLAVLDAVGYAHAAGVVHRDLKPANILVSERGEPKLLDFGIAKLVAAPGDEETRTLLRALTPAYASPEQVRGERIGAASDVYSLGVVLYELLAETLPYRLDGRRVQTVEDAIREQDPEPPSDALARTATGELSAEQRLDLVRRRRALRGDLDAVLLKTLRKEPEARYASVAALAEDLRRVLAGQAVAARGGDLAYRARKLLHRHARLAALVLLAVAALVLALPPVRSRIFGRAPAAADLELAILRTPLADDPATESALRAGADHLGRHDGTAARAAFERALASAAGHGAPAEALAWDGLARAESLRGEVGREADAARRAATFAAAIAGDEGERLRARALVADTRWDAAIPALEGLFGRQPGRVDIGLDLVTALFRSGKSDAAETALGRLRQVRDAAVAGSAAAIDPRIDLLDSEVAFHLGEFQRAALAASRAADGAHALGAGTLGLRAERLHAEALTRLDRRDEALTALRALLPRVSAAALAHEAAATELAIGIILARTATAEAAPVLERALAGMRTTGDRRGGALATLAIAALKARSGALAEGLRLSADALAEARAIGDRWAEGYVLSQRLALLNWADDQAAIDASIEPTLAALRESGNRQILLSTIANLAIVAIERVELDRAESYVDEAETLARKIGSQLTSANVDRARAYLEQTRGNFDLARRSYDTALEKARQAGVSYAIGSYLSDLSRLELEADRPEQAAARAEEAIATLQTNGDAVQRDAAEEVLAWADARRGDAAGARRRLAALRAAKGNDAGTALFGLLSGEAYVAEALGDWRQAAALRRRTIKMAEEWQDTGLVIGQQVGLARALAALGQHAELRALIDGLLPRAESLGLRGVARDLRSLQKPR